MELVVMISSAVAASIVAAFFKTRRPSATNLGFVSREWVIKHGAD